MTENEENDEMGTGAVLTGESAGPDNPIFRSDQSEPRAFAQSGCEKVTGPDGRTDQGI
jgi:hypothetical protein